MKPRRPSHATVVAYLALFVALAGSAYAAMRVGSKQVRNNSLVSADLKNRKAVGGKDVIPNSLGRKQVDERALNPRQLVAVSGSQSSGLCPLPQGGQVTCAATRIKLARESSVVAIASGGEYGSGSPQTAVCQLELDGNASIFGSLANPGELNSNTDQFGTNGFALTGVTQASVGRGNHQVAVVCGTGNAGTAVRNASVAVFAVGTPR